MPLVDTMKVSGRVKPEVNKEIDEWAAKLGMTKTAFLSLCIQAGMAAVARMFEPEKMLDDQVWERIIRAGKKVDGDVEPNQRKNT